MPARRSLARFATVAAAALTLAAAVDVALAAFGSQASSDGNVVTAAPDLTAPAVSAVVAGKASGGTPGFVKQGGGYYVYADVAVDTGSPASGIASVTANATSLTTGATAVPLVAGSYSAGGVSYGYRSATQTANASLVEGAKSVPVTATDGAANSGTTAGAVTVDNTAPHAADVQAANGGSTTSLLEQGDALTLNFSEPVEPQSIEAGWSGGPTPVVVRLVDNSLLGIGLNNDTVQIYDSANASALPLGTIGLGRTDYANGVLGGTVTYGVGATPSSMALSGATLTVTLGTYAAPGGLTPPARTTAGGNGTLTWTPVATPYDRAQNVLDATAASESGAADRDF